MDQRTQIILIGLLIVFLIFTYVRRKPAGTPNINAALGILGDVNENIKIMQDRVANPQSIKKFQTKGWFRFKNKVGFLESDVNASIDEAFALAGDFNTRIDLARKNRVLATLQDMQLEKLREPLNKSKAGLSDWLRANYQKEMQNKKKSFFS